MPEGWEPVSSSNKSRMACHAEQGIYFKEYLGRSPATYLRARVKGSRARRTQDNTRALNYFGIEAPQILHRGELINGHEYSITEQAPGTSLIQWLRDLNSKYRDPQALRHELLDAAGKFVGRIHVAGFVHGNLKPSKIIANKTNGDFKFSLIGNENTRRQAPPSGRNLLSNLIQLNAVAGQNLRRTDRMRFFLAWHTQMRHLSPAEAKLLAREAYTLATRQPQ